MAFIEAKMVREKSTIKFLEFIYKRNYPDYFNPPCSGKFKGYFSIQQSKNDQKNDSLLSKLIFTNGKTTEK